MTWGDVAPLIGLYMGTFAIGFCAGSLYRAYRQVMDSST